MLRGGTLSRIKLINNSQMQTLQTSRNSSYVGRTPSGNSRWSLDDGRRVQSSQVLTNTYNARNRQLAGMLDKAMSELRTSTNLQNEHDDTYVKAIELAIAKVEFVKVYLEDSTMPLPAEPSGNTPSDRAQESASTTTPSIRAVGLKTTENTQIDTDAQPPREDQRPGSPPESTSPTGRAASPRPKLPEVNVSDATVSKVEVLSFKREEQRPSAPLPTRSSIAQSNFA